MNTQKTQQDCFPCSLANITNIPYEQIRRASKKLCKKYSPSRCHGILIRDIPVVLKHFGIKYVVPKDGNYRTLGHVCDGRKAIFCVIFKDGGGHALAWDGFRLIDPTNGEKRTMASYMKSQKERIKCSFVAAAIETPLHLRLISLAYTHIDVYHHCEKVDLKCKLDKLLDWLSQKAKQSLQVIR